MAKIFRILILASISIYLFALFLPYIDYSYLDQKEIDVLTWHNYGSIIPVPNWFAWVMFCLTLLLSIGLYFYINFARLVYVWMVVLMILISPFMGLSTNTGLQVLFAQLLNVLDGAILAIAYLTNVSERFKQA